MKHKLICASAIIAMGAAFSAAANAEGDGHRRGGSLAGAFDRIDANADGGLTRQEMKAHFAKRMERVDRDGDGALSLDEMVHAATARIERRFARLDVDGDGKLTAEEASAVKGQRRLNRVFERFDRDGDGVITRDELSAMR